MNQHSQIAIEFANKVTEEFQERIRFNPIGGVSKEIGIEILAEYFDIYCNIANKMNNL